MTPYQKQIIEKYPGNWEFDTDECIYLYKNSDMKDCHLYTFVFAISDNDIIEYWEDTYSRCQEVNEKMFAKLYKKIIKFKSFR